MENEQSGSKYTEEQQKIIKYILKSAHFGEMSDVLKEVAKLTDNFDVEDTFIKDLIKEHNEEHLAVVKGDNDFTAILTPISATPDGWYVDQKSQQRIQVDHSTYRVLLMEGVELKQNEAFEGYRVNIEKHLKLYLTKYYKDTLLGYQTYVDWDEGDFTFYIAFTSKNLNFNNFHGGEWLSEWKVDKHGMKGKIRVNSHYFEDGNVALKEVKNFSNEITFTGEDQDLEAKDIVSEIEKAECQVHMQLEEMYENMTELFFKHMRRILPLTKQKMDWNLVQLKTMISK